MENIATQKKNTSVTMTWLVIAVGRADMNLWHTWNWQTFHQICILWHIL